jgi:hypothetical protein
MKLLRRSAQLAIGIALAASTCANSVRAQQLTPDQAADPTISAQAVSHASPDQPAAVLITPNTYREIDLLRRDGFSVASQATVSLRVLDKKGTAPLDLKKADITLIVNGTEREARLQAPGGSATAVLPLVLLVFPPNQPIVHSIGVRQAQKYFSGQPNEVLPWKVGILDANGKLLPFTNGRSQLLAYLDAVDHTVEPFQYASNATLPRSFRWEGSWLTNAEEAIAMMQNFDGPKVLLAMNPIADSMYGLNDQILSHDGPEALTSIAKHIGAHIYIANVGGPEALVPGGGAAADRPAQVNGGGTAPTLGTRPSFHMQVDPRDSAAMDYFAYRTSIMMQTAQDTLGGFSNSLSDLARYIHRDLDENYFLTFDLTAKDRDIGIPSVEVRLADHTQKVAIMDVTPLGSTLNADRQTISKEVEDRVKRESQHPVSSPDFRISQHVDYFPVRAGLQPILPMSCLIEWTGKGKSPRRLSVVETVQDLNIGTFLLDHDVQANWNGRSLSWERDGVLHPGHYVWRLAIHDERGKVYASVERKVDIDFPHGAAITASSLVVGKSCRADGSAILRKRSDVDPAEAPTEAHLQIDPMLAAECRVRPEPTDQFASTESLHALVRIYPSEKLAKRTPGSWTASFVLRSASGAVESVRDLPFTTDSESGYLAYVELPLDAANVRPGPHTLEVDMSGPGIRRNLKASRAISISQPATP